MILFDETQLWIIKVKNDKYQVSQEWQGKTIKDNTLTKFDSGIMFLGMPWQTAIGGEFINAARQKMRMLRVKSYLG